MNRYWKKRAVFLENLTQSRTLATMLEVNRMYAESTAVIDKKIRKIFSAYRKSGQISSDYALELLSTNQTAEERRELLELLSKTTDPKLKREIISVLDAPAYADRIERLQALQNRIYIEAISLGIREERLTQTRLVDTVKQSYYRTIYNAQIKNGFYYDFDRITDRRIKAMLAHKWEGGNYSSRIWKNNSKFVKKLQRTIEVGCMTGLTLDEMMEHITDDCIGSTSNEGQRFCASRLIRTEVNYFANQGILEGYRQAEIRQYYFLATLDLRTSEVCRRLDMKLFNMEDAEVGVNYPPMHPFCRSVSIPKESAEGGKRAAIDPETGKRIEVPSDMTYQQWYDRFVKNNPNASAKEKSINNAVHDKVQYEKYKSVLRELSPQTLDEFIKIKYNNSDKWNQLKYQYRTLNRYEIDGDVPAETVIKLDNAAFYTKKTGFDYSLFTGKVKKNIKNEMSNGGNAAVMDFEGETYFSHSKFGGVDSLEHSIYTGQYPTVTLSKNRIFTVKDLGDGVPRQYDTEAKFLEFVATKKLQTDKFTVTILSEKHICKSCQGVVEQFKEMYPNATINIVSGKQGYNGNEKGLKTWKNRKKVK